MQTVVPDSSHYRDHDQRSTSLGTTPHCNSRWGFPWEGWQSCPDSSPTTQHCSHLTSSADQLTLFTQSNSEMPLKPQSILWGEAQSKVSTTHCTDQLRGNGRALCGGGLGVGDVDHPGPAGVVKLRMVCVVHHHIAISGHQAEGKTAVRGRGELATHPSWQWRSPLVWVRQLRSIEPFTPSSVCRDSSAGASRN